MRGVRLEDLTWPEAKAWFDRGAPVIVPIGAISKEHGHHLPLKTDYLYARELSRRVAEVLPVVVAPVVSFGYYPAFVRYPGSQSLCERDLRGAAARNPDEVPARRRAQSRGAEHRRVDGSRSCASSCATSTRRPACACTRPMSACSAAATRGLAQQQTGGHGDEVETSVILAIEPGAVRMDRARVDYGHALSRAGGRLLHARRSSISIRRAAPTTP